MSCYQVFERNLYLKAHVALGIDEGHDVEIGLRGGVAAAGGEEAEEGQKVTHRELQSVISLCPGLPLRAEEPLRILINPPDG